MLCGLTWSLLSEMAKTKNIAASVRQRLYNLAKKRGDGFQILLTRYTVERLLYRLGQSPHRAGFILKGATLFSLWGDEPYRPTRDLDLLGVGESDLSRPRDVFRELCRLQVQNDGIRFDPDTVDAVPTREDADYGDVRVTLLAYLDRARVPVQVDVGFGDALVPLPEDVLFPTIPGFSVAEIEGVPPRNCGSGKVPGNGDARFGKQPDARLLRCLATLPAVWV